MAVEYVLYRQEDIQKSEQIKKTQTKLTAQIEKVFSGIITKESDENLITNLNIIKDKTLSMIAKDIESKIEAVPICTVTNTKTYVEMPFNELEERMNTEPCIIIGDDGSKYKSASALKKYYN